jgi:hypothetical protein
VAAKMAELEGRVERIEQKLESFSTAVNRSPPAKAGTLRG